MATCDDRVRTPAFVTIAVTANARSIAPHRQTMSSSIHGGRPAATLAVATWSAAPCYWTVSSSSWGAKLAAMAAFSKERCLRTAASTSHGGSLAAMAIARTWPRPLCHQVATHCRGARRPCPMATPPALPMAPFCHIAHSSDARRAAREIVAKAALNSRSSTMRHQLVKPRPRDPHVQSWTGYCCPTKRLPPGVPQLFRLPYLQS
mmetsp:Transcript_101350/g.285864  ORF Transcript_101350/g.285864 Transcript_101350/m.285864 type:complete len:205 (-) Transcript_101350:2473-3087(-)